MEKQPGSALESPSIPIEMYAVSGHGIPDLEKYLKNKAREDPLLEDIARQLQCLKEAGTAPPTEASAHTQDALKSEIESVRVAAVRQAYLIPEEYPHLVTAALENDTEAVKIAVVEGISMFRIEERASLLRLALASEAETVRAAAVQSTSWLVPEEQMELLGVVLKNDTPLVQVRAVQQIQSIPEKEQEQLFLIALTSSSELVRATVLQEIDVLPKSAQVELIETALEDEAPAVRVAAMQEISCLPKEEREAQIRIALESEVEAVRVSAMQQISWLPKEEREAQIRTALVIELEAMRVEAMQRICWLPEEEQERLIRIALANETIAVQTAAIGMTYLLSETKERNLLKEFLESERGTLVVEPPLYTNHPDLKGEDGRIQRRNFEKTGSKTTLLGGSLKNEVIIRHVSVESFITWKELFENYEGWKQAGFEYVPIEPIQSYRLNKIKGEVEVAAGVLDLSLNQWLQLSSRIFKNELVSQRNKIKDFLLTHGIEHGHLHNNNFVLRFFRDTTGKLDLSQTPRLYLIDFDRASPSIENAPK